MRGYRARTNDIGSRLWNNRSVIEEALRRQNKLAEEQITLLRAREKKNAAALENFNPNVNSVPMDITPLFEEEESSKKKCFTHFSCICWETMNNDYDELLENNK